jgi:hypothetical protein
LASPEFPATQKIDREAAGSSGEHEKRKLGFPEVPVMRKKDFEVAGSSGGTK